MGNRAVITDQNKNIGIYLHWNGGRDSVEAFVEYCKMRNFRGGDYGFARLVQVISNFMGADGLSVGIDTYDRLDTDNGDNGTYIVDLDKWEIVDRLFMRFPEQNEYDLTEMLLYIDKCQPEDQRLGEEYINGFWVESEKDLRIGDRVFGLYSYGEDSAVSIYTVKGYEVKGKYSWNKSGFYTDEYAKSNPNAYVHYPVRVKARG